ncbi:threonine/serine dehydratase [Ferrovibrio sp.]|uniref:threonine/serine dehydratase n=1 Tax=Ferrovibrio sp. TaxID=1917215 RepID=UPI0025C35028|nr:threonine/serine dehydratase [Ferrovibrio sp.]MBX3453046.1 threonine/serine dehydratase [Ferrovibrio sp.]
MTQIDSAAIAETAARSRAHLRRTPVIRVDPADFGLPSSCRLDLKLEALQHSGSFKARGAFANLLANQPGRPIGPAGVVAASGGNHGAAVAYAAKRLGIKATIFVPTVSSPIKMRRIKEYGADLRVVGERYADALAASEAWMAQSGALPVHAYDQPETLLGQGGVALEFEQQVPDLDTLLVAVGGGGLIGGIAAWYAGRVKLIAVEPENAPSLHAALAAGRPVDVAVSGLAADSLGAKQVGALMFPLAQRYVAQSLVLPDSAIAAAQRALWDALRLVIEPGGATALAALLNGAYRPAAGEKVGVLVCGANAADLDFTRAAE